MLVQNVPMEPLTTEELDEVYALPYMRTYHPIYEKDGGIPGIQEVEFSITHNRGCFGSCNFCALAYHQGRTISSRSHNSVLDEVKKITEMDDFKGYIHDVGGPTANFRKPSCDAQLKRGVCADKKCLAPSLCPAVEVDHSDYLDLLRKIRAVPKVKKVFIRSGVRFDYLLADNDETFFKANNLSVPTTWDEMWETCKKIKEINPDSTPLGYDSEANWFITNAEQRGYLYTSATTKVNGVELGNQGHFRFNNEGNRNFLAELKGYFDKQYFTTKTIFGNYTSNIYKSATKQRAYMVIGSTGGATNQLRTDSVTGIATLPQAAEGKKAKDAAISQGPSICMLKKDNPQESIASWLFLKYLTTNIEAQTSFAKASGYIPASQLAQQSEGYQAYLKGANGTTNEGITALSAKAAVDQTNMYFASPTFVGSSYARDAAGAVMVDVLSKGVSPEDALKNAVASCVSKLS